MSGSGFDIRSKRVSIPKEFSVATPEEFVKKFGGNRVINKVVHITTYSFIFFSSHISSEDRCSSLIVSVCFIFR